MDAPNQPDMMKAPSDQLVAPINGASIFANPALTSQIALSPTPRKSERERKHVSYDKLNTHGQHNSDEDSVLGDGYPGTHIGPGHQHKDKPKPKTHNDNDNSNKK